MSASPHARVTQLEQVFAHIGATRMQGVPVLNQALRVQAVGFERIAEGDVQVLQGILITPWFMNLLRVPLRSDASTALAPGSKRSHVCGGQLFEFIAGREDALGCFEACSLFSPMFEFADQAGAVSTATEILKLLRTPSTESAPVKPAAPVAVAVAAAITVSHADAPSVPSRRGFLLGRTRPGAAP